MANAIINSPGGGGQSLKNLKDGTPLGSLQSLTSEAKAENSTALGFNTSAEVENSLVLGQYGDLTTGLFGIANGTSTSGKIVFSVDGQGGTYLSSMSNYADSTSNVGNDITLGEGVESSKFKNHGLTFYYDSSPNFRNLNLSCSYIYGNYNAVCGNFQYNAALKVVGCTYDETTNQTTVQFNNTGVILPDDLGYWIFRNWGETFIGKQVSHNYGNKTAVIQGKIPSYLELNTATADTPWEGTVEGINFSYANSQYASFISGEDNLISTPSVVLGDGNHYPQARKYINLGSNNICNSNPNNFMVLGENNTPVTGNMILCGNYLHGSGTTALGRLYLGRFNRNDGPTNNIITIGIGSSDIARSNLMTVSANGYLSITRGVLIGGNTYYREFDSSYLSSYGLSLTDRTLSKSMSATGVNDPRLPMGNILDQTSIGVGGSIVSLREAKICYINNSVSFDTTNSSFTVTVREGGILDYDNSTVITPTVGSYLITCDSSYTVAAKITAYDETTRKITCTYPSGSYMYYNAWNKSYVYYLDKADITNTFGSQNVIVGSVVSTTGSIDSIVNGYNLNLFGLCASNIFGGNHNQRLVGNANYTYIPSIEHSLIGGEYHTIYGNIFDSVILGNSCSVGTAGAAATKNYSTENVFLFGYNLRTGGNQDLCIIGTSNLIPTDSQPDNYRFIVGNGSSNGGGNTRSNAFTVKTDGTAQVGKDPVNSMDVATKQYVDNNTVNMIKQTITLTTTGWSGSGPYTQQVNVEGILTTDTVISSPMYNDDLTIAQNEAIEYSKIFRADVTTDGQLTATCINSKPTIDLSIELVILRKLNS